MSGHRDAAQAAGRKIADAVHQFVKASMARAEKEQRAQQRGGLALPPGRTGEQDRLQADLVQALTAYGEELLRAAQQNK
jgi:hypothetical protein